MSVFGLDPKLYGEKEKEEKFPENHLGRIFFNLRFWNFELNYGVIFVFLVMTKLVKVWPSGY